jgi:hypothetical protein
VVVGVREATEIGTTRDEAEAEIVMATHVVVAEETKTTMVITDGRESQPQCISPCTIAVNQRAAARLSSRLSLFSDPRSGTMLVHGGSEHSLPNEEIEAIVKTAKSKSRMSLMSPLAAKFYRAVRTTVAFVISPSGARCNGICSESNGRTSDAPLPPPSAPPPPLPPNASTEATPSLKVHQPVLHPTFRCIKDVYEGQRTF